MNNPENLLSEIKEPEVTVTFFQGFLIRLIDFIVDIGIIFLTYFLTPRQVSQDILSISPLMFPGIVVVTITLYRIVFLLLFNKTIGMMVCHAKLLNKNLQPLTPLEKMLSIFRTSFSATRYYKEK